MSRSPRASKRVAIAAVVLAALVVLGVGIFVVQGFVEGRREAAEELEQEAAIKAPQRVSMDDGDTVIALDATAQEKAGIEILEVRNAAQPELIRGHATVVDLSPLSESLRSHAAAKAQVRMAQAKVDASRKVFERARKLHDDEQNVSTAQLQSAEGIYRIDEAALAAAQSLLGSQIASASQAWGPVLGRALVDDGPLLKRLFDHRSVLLQVTLPAGAAPARMPTDAVVITDAGVRRKLQLVSPATRSDGALQGASFLYTAPAGNDLLPGMAVPAYLPSGKSTEGALIPASAIVWWQGKPWVYVRTDAPAFVRREVAVQRVMADGGHVVSNLEDGSEVVVQGAQMLLSEEQRAQIHLSGEDQHP